MTKLLSGERYFSRRCSCGLGTLISTDGRMGASRGGLRIERKQNQLFFFFFSDGVAIFLN